MTQQIIPADEKFRKRVTLVLSVAAAFGLIVVVMLRTYLAQQLDLAEHNLHGAVDNVAWLFRAFLIVSGAALIGGAGYCGWLAYQIRRSGQYPPPGMKVFRDTEIRRGGQATLRAALAVGCSVLLLLAATAGAWHAERMFTAAIGKERIKTPVLHKVTVNRPIIKPSS